jgi:hypothetical protein
MHLEQIATTVSKNTCIVALLFISYYHIFRRMVIGNNYLSRNSGQAVEEAERSHNEEYFCLNQTANYPAVLELLRRPAAI